MPLRLHPPHLEGNEVDIQLHLCPPHLRVEETGIPLRLHPRSLRGKRREYPSACASRTMGGKQRQFRSVSTPVARNATLWRGSAGVTLMPRRYPSWVMRLRALARSVTVAA